MRGTNRPERLCPGALYEAFAPAEAKALWDRFEFVYTPKHGSWLNVAEVELNVLIRQVSTAISIPSTPCAPGRRLAGSQRPDPSQGRLAGSARGVVREHVRESV